MRTTISTPASNQAPGRGALVEKREAMRALLMKARMYRIFALAFAIIGLFIFVTLYVRDISGQGYEALKNPYLVVMILMPFLPAAILLKISDKAQKKLKSMVKSLETIDKTKS